MEPKNFNPSRYIIFLSDVRDPGSTQDKRPAVRWLDYQHRQPGKMKFSRWFDRWPGDIRNHYRTDFRTVVFDFDSNTAEIRVEQTGTRNRVFALYIEEVSGGGGRHITTLTGRRYLQ
jgi:hypothetical protein